MQRMKKYVYFNENDLYLIYWYLHVDIQVNLVNGETPYSGRVEIVRNGITGTICDDGWTDASARIICKMLGFR